MTRKFREKLQRRNAAVIADYKELINAGGDLFESKQILAQRYEVNVVTIYRIINKAKEQAYNEPE